MNDNIRATGLPETIELEGQTFSLVQGRRNGTGIYRNADGSQYARWGEPTEIARELALHRELATAGFPVADLTSSNQTSDGSRYFIETSLGAHCFSALFRNDVIKKGSISDATFEQFLKVITRVVRAQIGTAVTERDWDHVASAIMLETLRAELPHEQPRIYEAWQLAQSQLNEVPFVLTHGDLTTHNIFPDGIIDFENRFTAPFGYDPIAALVVSTLFPRIEMDAHKRWYRLSLPQAQRYLNALTEVSSQPLHALFAPLLFLRGCFHAVRMQAWPNLQAWRYARFRTLLDLYLSDQLTLERWWELDDEVE